MRRRGTRAGRPAGRDSGFTLLELLVVLAIMGLLAAIIGPNVIGYLGRGKSQAAAVQARSVATALNLFRVDVGRYPTEAEGLDALLKAPATAPGWNGPYLPEAKGIIDPWGNPYHLKVPGEHGEVDVFSLGSDNAPGGSGEAKDVGNW